MIVKNLVKNCNTLSFENGKAAVFTNQDILITGNMIEAIGPTDSLPMSPDAISINAAGLLAVPGTRIAYYPT